MPTISSFKNMENKHDVYRGKYCMIYFSESLRGHAMKIIIFKKKKIKLLTKKQEESYENTKYVIFVKKNLNKHLKDKKYSKVRDHCHYSRI